MSLDPTGVVSAGLDAASGVASAVMARNAYKHRYQDMVKDMRRAGLNPALAYGQSAGSPTTTDLPDVGSSYARGAQSAASAKQSTQQADLVKAQADNWRMQTEYLRQTLPDRVRYPGLMNENLAGRTGLLGEQTSNTAAQTRWLNESAPVRIQEMQSRIGLQGAEAERARAGTRYTDVQANYLSSMKDARLRELIARIGQIGADTTYRGAATDEMSARAYLERLGFPRAENEADAQGSYYMKHFGPYEGSAGAVLKALGAALGLYGGLKLGVGSLPWRLRGVAQDSRLRAAGRF